MTSPAAPSPTSSIPDAAAESPTALAAEALAAASRRVLESRRTAAAAAGHGGSKGTAGIPNPNGGTGGEGAEDGSTATTMATTAGGTKRGRNGGGEGYGAEGGSGRRGDCRSTLAVASGSADEKATGSSNSSRHGGLSSTATIGGGGGRTGGGSLGALLGLASPNTLEGGRGRSIDGGGDEDGGGSMEEGGGGTAMFAATIKRRRRGGEKTSANTNSSSSNGSSNDGVGTGSIDNLFLGSDENAGGAIDDASRTVAKSTEDGNGNGNDAEERLDAIWKAVHSNHRHHHQFGPGVTGHGDEEDDAGTTLLASPSTVNTANTFDSTDNTHGSNGTDRHGTNSHALLASLTSAALSKTESLLLAEMEALIASGVQAHHDRDSALRELDLMKELAEGRGREVRRLQESERQSRETISNLFRNVESAKSDARSASRRIQAESRLRNECITLRTERDAAYADAAESKRRAALAEEEARTARAQLGRCQRDKAQMERDSRAALSLARTLDGHTSTDSAYYKRQMAALNEQVQKLHATVAEQNHTINELRRQRERSMSQNQLSQLRAGGGVGGGKKSRHRK